ncbi:TIPIN protein, partial [Chloropsis hardwickii]|nr:TIPIN protein [Chloropsis hardwickii]
MAMLDPLVFFLFDLPDYENFFFETFPPLPPPASPGRDDAEWVFFYGDPDGNFFFQTKDSAVSIFFSVKRPRPKFFFLRLISEIFFSALRHMFDNFFFKGKGHEAEDFFLLIQHMEHWFFFLFPKLQFEDFIDRVESLGNNFFFQTFFFWIRLDLPILHEDFKNNEEAFFLSNGLDPAAFFFHSPSGSAEVFFSLPGPALTDFFLERMKKNRQFFFERRQARLQCLLMGFHFFFSTELFFCYSEEEFDSFFFQDPTALTEFFFVPAAKDAPIFFWGEDELECAFFLL